MPGGHAAVVDDLADHCGVTASIIIGQERERADMAGSMARLAFLLKDHGNLGIGHRPNLDRARRLELIIGCSDLCAGCPNPRGFGAVELTSSSSKSAAFRDRLNHSGIRTAAEPASSITPKASKQAANHHLYR